MASPTLGLGLAPLGTPIFGYGSPATASPLNIAILPDAQGNTMDAPSVDPFTQDYVFTSDGALSGQSAISQQVYLSLITTLGSSAIATLGSSVTDIKTMNLQSIQAQVQNEIQSALSSMVGSGLISLISINVTINS